MTTEELLQQAEQYFWHGQFPETLNLLEQLDTQEAVTEFKQLQGQLLRCRIFAITDIKKAQNLANQILKNSEALNQILIRMDTLLVMTEAWLELGKLATSKTFLDQGKALLQTITDVKEEDVSARKAKLLALEGGLFAYQQEIDRAIEPLEQSLTLSRQLGTSQTIAKPCYYLGIMYMILGEYDRALDYLQQSLTLYKQLEHPHGMAQTLFHLGRTYANKADMEQGTEVMQKSRTLSEELGNQHGIAYALVWLGQFYAVNKGDLNQTIKLYRNSLAICEQQSIPGTFTEAKAFQFLGYAYSLKGELELALEYLKQSLTLFEEQGFQNEIGVSLAFLGETYWHQGRVDVAVEYTHKSLNIWEEQGNELYIAVDLVNLVILSLELDQRESARRYVHQLIQLKPTILEKGGLLFVSGIDLARALVLKASSRASDKMKAQELFQQLVDEEELWPHYKILANLNLCKSLFLEYKFTEEP